MPDAVYVAADPVEAEIVHDYLSAHGIESDIRGSYAWGAVGEVPFPEAYPRLFLRRERDRDRARALIRDYEAPIPGDGHWCAGCGELSPPAFLVCWNCGQGLDA